MGDPREQARAMLEQQLPHWADRHNSDYAALHAALVAALRGEAAAADTLLRVFDEPGFAGTNSCNEVGVAALGLALLGRRDAVPRLQKAVLINFGRSAVPLALQVLSPSPPEGRGPG